MRRGSRGPGSAKLALCATVVLGLACGEAAPDEVEAEAEVAELAPPPGPAEVTYVGVAVCESCHADETAAWRGSHHDRAMERVGPETVLGPFEGETFADAGVETVFRREGDRYRVRTEGADGAETELDVAYTFGVFPLQQLLVAQPGGRYQALQVAWDARPAEQGGQRWFSLQPGERIPPGDVLHWTGTAHTWNDRCAACHSTALERRYDPSARSYETGWAEIDVACEACHGPGSRHVTLAREAGPEAAPVGGLLVDLRDDHVWRFDEGAPIARREPAQARDAQTEVCAPCHSRRAELVDAHAAGRPFLDDYRPALIDEGLYHADGQIQDEVYV